MKQVFISTLFSNLMVLKITLIFWYFMESTYMP